jgi:putative ABC transport system permease protein
MNTALLDFRQAIRNMRKNLASTFLSVLMLAVGIGATSAIFSVFYSVLLQPLPFPEPSRLVQLWESRTKNQWNQATFTEANFWDVQARARTFEGIASFHAMNANLTGADEPEQVSGGSVSSGFFRVLGVKPVVGRDFLPEEDQPGHDNNVMLLRYRFWKSHFNGDPQVVGKTVRLNNNKTFQVVGVLPPGEPWLDAADIFVPFVHRANPDRGSFEFQVIGRLARGVSLSTAQADLQTVAKSLAAEYPKDDEGMGVLLSTSEDWLADSELRTKLWVLMGAVGFLLLIACVNLANLLLARATGRTREIAVRAALGASRVRIFRLVLTESLALGLVGAMFGILLAMASLAAIKSANPGGIPRIEEVGMNPWVLGFTLVAAVLTGIISGLFPAFQAPYKNIVAGLREGDRSQAGSRAQKRLRAALVSVEVALSLMLLVGAGLLLRSFDRLLRVDRGFQSENRLLVGVNIPRAYNERADQLINGFLERVSAVPGVQSASAMLSRPIVGWDPGMGIVAAERPDGDNGRFPWVGWRVVSGEYFRTLGIPILKGRTFNPHDQIGKPWRVIVSKRLADTLWPGEDPIGRQALLWKGQEGSPAEVVGVAGNQRERGLEADPTLTVYLPSYGSGPGPMQFAIHTSGNPTALAPVLRSILKEMDPNLPLSDVQTMDEVVSRSIAPRRFNMFLLTIFATVALLLALIGIYGVLAYSVGRRTAEIGLRVALGATPRSVLTLIVGQGMRPILIGIGIGLTGAVALSRFVGSLLFNVRPVDPLTYGAVALLVAVTALFSCYVPALRALRIDPVAALRQE